MKKTPRKIETMASQIAAAKRSYAKWPKWMRDVAYFAAPFPKEQS